MMTVILTCGKCGYRIETGLEESVETSNLLQARLFLADQAQEHTHSGENFKWRLGWSDRSGPLPTFLTEADLEAPEA